MQKKKPVKKQTKKRWNKIEVESKAITFLLENPEKGFKEFCKKIKINYQYFTKLCDVDKIYSSVDEINLKKQAEIKKAFEEKQKREVKATAFEISKLYDLTLGTLGSTIKDIKEKNLEFKTKGEAVRCQTELTKVLVELKKEGLIPEQPKENDNYSELRNHIKELIETNVKNNPDNIGTNESTTPTS